MSKIPDGATHKHKTCKYALGSFLKLENGDWFVWYDVGNGEWLPVTYPGWIEDIEPLTESNQKNNKKLQMDADPPTHGFGVCYCGQAGCSMCDPG